jgi:hypothetical protein
MNIFLFNPRTSLTATGVNRMSHHQRPRNAWKHGGYSNLGVLPGEKAQEFKRLHQSLIQEYEPSGPTERDAVLSLANCMWRKSRLTIYAQTAAASAKVNDVDPLQAALDAYKAARKARWDPDPPSAGEQEESREQQSIPEEETREDDPVKEETLEQQLAKLGTQITPEKLIEEIELADRLDARIDRLLKRLFQLKTAKQMLGLGSRSQDGSSPVRKLSSSRASRANGGGQLAGDEAYAAGGDSSTTT